MKKLANPICTAKVYLAFGRKREAKEVLEAALKENPDNEALKENLAEIINPDFPTKGLNIKQSIAIVVLLLVATTLKFLDYQPWLTDAGSWLGFSALIYMAVCLARRRRV